MAFQPVPDTAGVELIFDQFDQTVENTLYFRDEEGGLSNLSNLALLAETMTGWWAAEMQMLAPESVTLREVKATYLGDSTGPQATFPFGENGENIQVGLPTNVTLAVSFRTAMLGRSHRGRNYYVGLTELQVTGNTVVDTLLPVLAAGYSAIPDYLSVVFDPPLDWVVVSRFGLGAERPFGITTRITTVVIVDDKSDSMRRRLSGRGE